MFTKRDHENTFMFGLRWTARILGIVCIGVLLLFIFGGVLDVSHITWEELGVVMLFPLGLLSGLILGWLEEVKGGALAVGSVFAFYVLYDLALGGSLRPGSWFLLFGIPGLLFLVHGLLTAVMTKVERPAMTIRR